jgi:hypothetical protein
MFVQRPLRGRSHVARHQRIRSGLFRELKPDNSNVAMADQTWNQGDKASWLRIAQNWLDMLPEPSQSEQRFDAQSEAKGTGQSKSESSH